jgi:hypothetical protein
MIEGGMNNRRQRQRAASHLTGLGWSCVALAVVLVMLIGVAAFNGYY